MKTSSAVTVSRKAKRAKNNAKPGSHGMSSADTPTGKAIKTETKSNAETNAKIETNAQVKAHPREEYLTRWEAQGKEWDDQLAILGARADKASAEVRAEFHRWQREFSDQRTTAQKRLEALRTANSEAWEEVKGGMESAWNEVKSGFENAKKKFT